MSYISRHSIGLVLRDVVCLVCTERLARGSRDFRGPRAYDLELGVAVRVTIGLVGAEPLSHTRPDVRTAEVADMVVHKASKGGMRSNRGKGLGGTAVELVDVVRRD